MKVSHFKTRFWSALLLIGCCLSANGSFGQQPIQAGLKPADSEQSQEDEFRWSSLNQSVDDPNLPRYLFIGDSISSNYGKAILDLHAGKLNVHHPLMNCGSSSQGRALLSEWLGDFHQPGKQWDVISFNFGHWDSGTTKQEYQENLHDIIRQLKQTRAQLVWVTTCPVPNGFQPIDTNAMDGSGAGPRSGMMQQFLNPWAAEVMDEYPEITICDQWQFIHDRREDLYKEWFKGSDVHFSDSPAYSIGRLLAHHVLELVGERRGPGWKRPDGAIAARKSARGSAPWRPAPYAEVKAGALYSESASVEHLPERWRDSQRLPTGFPKDFQIELATQVVDDQGWSYDLVKVANHLRLKRIKAEIRSGTGLQWYELPNEDRFQHGPGLTADELIRDLAANAFPPNMTREEFFEGTIRPNISTLYDLYRITRDRYYSEQIVKYAEAVELILQHQPPLLPEYQAAPGRPNPAFANDVWAQVNAARLLLEHVRIDRAGANDPRVATARLFLASSIERLSLLTNDSFETGFQPGENTSWLVEKRNVPKRAAQIIEFAPWSQTLVLLAGLTAATRAMEELDGIEGNENHRKLVGIYRRTIAAGFELLQRENNCIVRDGLPYFFHAHHPLQDKKIETRMGHPMFAGEKSALASVNLWHLIYIWDSGESFGCPTALVAGYANSLIDWLDFPTGEKRGEAFPSARIHSPWYIAATGQARTASSQLADDGLFASPFAPNLLKSQRLWSARKARNEELQFLRAANLYQEWNRERERSRQ